MEEALSEAFVRASARWPHEGTPANVAGWLYTTAWRVIVGRLRAEAVAGRKAPLLAVGQGWVPPPDPDGVDAIEDERLQLILLCCHPALRRDARSALALRLVIGTSTEEIARLFLVSTATMAARITHAKKKIVAAGIPLALPIAEELQARLDEVCRNYLAFTAAYAPRTGDQLLRADLAGEAVELARIWITSYRSGLTSRRCLPSCSFSMHGAMPACAPDDSSPCRIKTVRFGMRRKFAPA